MVATCARVAQPLRSEVRDAVFTDAGDQAVADGPRHRRARPRRDAARIREAGERARLRQALGRKLLGIVIEDDRKLRARDRIVGAKVLGLMPETTPVSFAHQMASVYQRPRSTSSNGGASFLSS